MLLSVVTQLLPYIGYPRTLNALKAINDVTRGPSHFLDLEHGDAGMSE